MALSSALSSRSRRRCRRRASCPTRHARPRRRPLLHGHRSAPAPDLAHAAARLRPHSPSRRPRRGRRSVRSHRLRPPAALPGRRSSPRRPRPRHRCPDPNDSVGCSAQGRRRRRHALPRTRLFHPSRPARRRPRAPPPRILRRPALQRSDGPPGPCSRPAHPPAPAPVRRPTRSPCRCHPNAPPRRPRRLHRRWSPHPRCLDPHPWMWTRPPTRREPVTRECRIRRPTRPRDRLPGCSRAGPPTRRPRRGPARCSAPTTHAAPRRRPALPRGPPPSPNHPSHSSQATRSPATQWRQASRRSRKGHPPRRRPPPARRPRTSLQPCSAPLTHPQ